MSKDGDAHEMHHRAVTAFSDDGKLNVDELDHILEAGLRDGKLDAGERAVIKKVITSLTASDFTPELWARVEQVVARFDLDDMN
jgi:hypothetical protein